MPRPAMGSNSAEAGAPSRSSLLGHCTNQGGLAPPMAAPAGRLPWGRAGVLGAEQEQWPRGQGWEGRSAAAGCRG